MKLIYVEWVDAVASSGWEKHEEAESIHLCRSIGYVVKEDKDCLILASTISQDQNNCRIAIPKAWIKKKRNFNGIK